MTRSPHRNAIAKNQKRQLIMNSYSKSLLFSLSLVVFMCQSVAADEILVRYKSGETGLLEVIGVVGQTVRLKNPKTGNAKNFPLNTFDEATLIRIIGELGQRVKATPAARPSSPKPSGATDKAIEITYKRLAVFGEDYVGKKVRFSDASFMGISQTYISRFPMVQIRTDGLITTYRKDEANKWVNFRFDGNPEARGTEEMCFYTLANKKQWAEFLLGLNRGNRIHIEGIVVDLPTDDDYGIIVTKIERVK